MEAGKDSQRPVLAVDLDGTLIRSDLFISSVLTLLRRNPLYAFAMAFWLLQGRAVLKARIADRVSIAPESLPYRQELLEYIRDQRAQGRRIVLASGSDQRLAQRVADHLGCFNAVLASDGITNRTGRSKGELLREYSGSAGYDYVGNSRVDLPVWEAACGVLVANPSQRFCRKVAERFEVQRVFH